MNLQTLSNDQLHKNLVIKTATERQLTAEIVEYIHEVDRRRLYLRYDCSNILDYLVREMKYSKASAMRRLDAARLIGSNPEVVAQLSNGEINLSQVSLVAQGLKQAKREANVSGEKFFASAELKTQLLNQVKSKPIPKAQAIVAQALNLEIKSFEKKVVQRDESVRLEITFTREEYELLQEMKDMLSNKIPGATNRDVLVEALKEFKRRKNPAREVKNSRVSSAAEPNSEKLDGQNLNIANPTNADSMNADSMNADLKLERLTTEQKSFAEVRRSVFRKDKCCQWKYNNGKLCGSTFQLQVDHKQSKWLGGSDEESNLQLLCGAHNRIKYRQEIGLQ